MRICECELYVPVCEGVDVCVDVCVEWVWCVRGVSGVCLVCVCVCGRLCDLQHKVMKRIL